MVGVVTVKVITQVFGEAGVPPAAVLPPVIVTELTVDVTTPVMHWGEVGVPKTVIFAGRVGRVSVRFIPL